MPLSSGLQVFFAQIGKLFSGPRKHFGPHFLSMRVRSWPLGATLPHPDHGTAFLIFLVPRAFDFALTGSNFDFTAARDEVFLVPDLFLVDRGGLRR
tara:strand:- start:214 stop:501 length:288 start_codon:yes stop_codon:yes gene_type:complete